MSPKSTAARFSRAEDFLVRLAALTDPTESVGTGDVEASARRVVDYLTARVAEGDLDSVLAALGRTLGREMDSLQVQARAGRGGLPRSERDSETCVTETSRTQEPDPFFWG